MKILKIENGKGYYISKEIQWNEIDQIDRDGLMYLVNLVIGQNVEMDTLDDKELQNQAQQIIYKSIFDKLKGLSENRSKFKDESDRLYLEAIETYRQYMSGPAPS